MIERLLRMFGFFGYRDVERRRSPRSGTLRQQYKRSVDERSAATDLARQEGEHTGPMLRGCRPVLILCTPAPQDEPTVPGALPAARPRP